MPDFQDVLVSGLYPIVSSALEVSHRLATTGGSLSAITIHNYNVAARMVLLIDSASATQPANGAVTPIWAYPVAGASSGPGALPIDWTIPTVQFQKGLWVVLSTVLTTPFILTAAGAADGYFSALINIAGT